MTRETSRCKVDENGIVHWERKFGADIKDIIKSKLVGRLKIKDITLNDIRKDLSKLYPNRKLTAENYKVYKCKLKKKLLKESNESKN